MTAREELFGVSSLFYFPPHRIPMSIQEYLNSPAEEECPRRGKMILPFCSGCDCMGVTEACDSRFEPKNQTEKLRAALTAVIAEIDRNTCTHENTYRGGAIWTFCEACGKKWADDEGGIKPNIESQAVINARAILRGSG